MDFLAPLTVVIVILAAVLTGVFIGVSISYIRHVHFSKGRLRIDHSVPDEPAMMFVELKGVTPDQIANDKFVLFEVVNESYISHD